MSDTIIGTLLSSSRTVDIIAFVVENPFCSRSDVYRELGRSSMIRRKIESLVDSGMLSETVVDRRSLLEPTGRGSRIASVLMDLEAIVADASKPTDGSDDLPLTSGSPSHRPHGTIPDR